MRPWEEVAVVLIFQNYIFILAYGSPKRGNQLLPLKRYSPPYVLPIANLLHFMQYIYCELCLEYTDFIEKHYARRVWYPNLCNKYLHQLPSAPRQQ